MLWLWFSINKWCSNWRTRLCNVKSHSWNFLSKSDLSSLYWDNPIIPHIDYRQSIKILELQMHINTSTWRSIYYVCSLERLYITAPEGQQDIHVHDPTQWSLGSVAKSARWLHFLGLPLFCKAIEHWRSNMLVS